MALTKNKKIDKVNCPHVFVLKKDIFRCEVCNTTIGQWMMAEKKLKIMKKSNLDRGTSVGFSKVKYEEWERDNNQNWENIWEQFAKACPAFIGNTVLFLDWLKESYMAPNKKEI